MSKLAFGCSHTYGMGLADRTKAWPSLLGAINYGLPGGSTDYIARTCEEKIIEHSPDIMYVLWPDWTRFELDGRQINPMNDTELYRNRTNDWLIDNWETQKVKVEMVCKKHNVILADLTMQNISKIIDETDVWPLALDGGHFAEPWHEWVSDLFRVRESFMRYRND